MHRIVKRSLTVVLAVAFLATAFAAPDRAVVVQRVRTELATILKKEVAKLPEDKPVVELGADDLHVVEWVMAVEEAFHIRIGDDKVVDPRTKKVRKDFSIASMTAIVMSAPQRPPSKKK